MATRAAVVALVLASGLTCAKDLDHLEPYPCADDGTCPDGLACFTGVCVVANIDTLGCDTKGVTCNPGTACYADACETTCGSDGDCGTGRLCTPAPPGSDSAAQASCMIDCTQDVTACPQGFTCVPRFTDASNVCLPGSTTLPACHDVESVQTCLDQLCGTSVDFTVPCNTSASTGNCLFNDACNAADTTSPCQCPVSNTLCNGTTQSTSNPCVVGSNGDPQCMCITPADLAPACASDHFQSQGECVCNDNRHLAYSCADQQTCEQRCSQGE